MDNGQHGHWASGMHLSTFNLKTETVQNFVQHIMLSVSDVGCAQYTTHMIKTMQAQIVD